MTTASQRARFGQQRANLASPSAHGKSEAFGRGNVSFWPKLSRSTAWIRVAPHSEWLTGNQRLHLVNLPREAVLPSVEGELEIWGHSLELLGKPPFVCGRGSICAATMWQFKVVVASNCAAAIPQCGSRVGWVASRGRL